MALITPGLTPRQRGRIADVLHRIGRVPLGQAASVSLDVDAAAGRVLSPTRPTDEDCFVVAEAVCREYGIDPLTAAFCYGHVLGLRLALRAVPAQRPQRATIGDEYARLTPEHRQAVKGIIRMLLRRQSPEQPLQDADDAPRPTKTTAERTRRATEDIKAARRWAREAGQMARART